MANYNSIARPYAKAFFELAFDEQTLEPALQFLQAAAAIATNPEAINFISNPLVGTEQQLQFFTALLAKLNIDFALGNNLLTLLAKRKRLMSLGNIFFIFDELRQESQKILPVKVVTADPLADNLVENMKAALKRKFAREIELTTELDKKLLGGAKIIAGDTVIDGSVRGKLQNLATALMN